MIKRMKDNDFISLAGNLCNHANTHTFYLFDSDK